MKPCILYSHAGSDNHGCEALVRTSIGIIKNVEVVYSGNVKADQKYGVDNIVELRSDKDNAPENIFKEFIYSIKYKISKDDKLYFRKIYRPFLHEIRKDRLYISIGGDNYCYHYSEWLEVLNTAINNVGAKTVLWGCSINEDELCNIAVIKDLQKYALITARESITYNLLKEKLPNSKVEYVPDTAFKLSVSPVILPDGFIKGKTIGLNVSPVILHSAKNSDKLLKCLKNLVDYIINKTDYQIALIPHVVIPGNDDRDILKLLYDSCADKQRLVVIEDASCSEIKGYISQCGLFIGARTHATIAAYSSFIPTLVLGYSVKSLGIAKDLFGTYENYVLPVQQIDDSEKLIQAFEWLNKNQINIKKKLKEIIPEYISRIERSKIFLEELNDTYIKN